MLYLCLITFVVVRVAEVHLGPGAAALVVLAALATRRYRLVVSALLALAVGLVPSGEGPLLGQSGTLAGTVVEVEAVADQPVRVRLASASFDGDGLDDDITARFALLEHPPPIGEAVRFEASLERTRAYYNPSPFPPEPGPLRAIGLSIPEPSGSAPWHVAVAIGLRQNLTFDDPVVTSLHRALVLGDRSELPPELRWAYQDTGLAHLLAISGFNLAVLGWGLFRIVRWVLLRVPRLAQGGRPSAWAAGLALAFVGAYTLVIMPSDATDRAMLGLGLALGAFIFQRHARGWRTFALCFLGALALAPEALMRPGFQLTFAATAALLASGPTVRRWRAWLDEPGRIEHAWVRSVGFAIGAVVIADVATFLATAPLGLAWFGQLSPHGLWLNLVAIPLMSLVVFPLALIAAFTGLDVGASFTGKLFDDLVMAAADLVGSTSTNAWPVALGMLACLGVLLTFATGRSRWIGSGLVAVALAIVALWPRAHDLELLMLDVGHGDALAVRMPDGLRVVVDTGGARFGDQGSRLLAERIVVPALRASGFGQIDLLVLTHADSDHAGAAPWLAARIPIGELWVSPCAERSPLVRQTMARVTASGGRVRLVTRQAPMSLGGAEVEVLWPPEDIVRNERCRMSENDASLVLSLRYAGKSLLLTGDIEAEAEAELVAHYGARLHADILKSPHHGSRTSSTDAFLDAVRPTTVLVSGEPDHPPWPPHPFVLERYRRRGFDVHITGTEGAIYASLTHEEIRISEPFRPP